MARACDIAMQERFAPGAAYLYVLYFDRRVHRHGGNQNYFLQGLMGEMYKGTQLFRQAKA